MPRPHYHLRLIAATLFAMCLFAFTATLRVDQKLLQATAAGTTYYISSDGNDANAGTSPQAPWQSIANVNTQTVGPLDIILFNRNDEFSGLLKITVKQVSASVTVGDYTPKHR